MAEPTMHITGEQSEPSISMAAGETPSVDGAVMKVAGETAEAGVQISVQAETPEPGIETETMGDGMPPEDLREPRERVTHWADHEFENNVTIAGTLRTKRWVHPHGCMFRTEEKLKEEYPQPTKGMWAMVGGCFPGSIWICEKDGEWNRAIEGAVTESDVAAKLMLYATKEWVKKYHKETYGPTQIDEDALNRYLNEYKYMTEKSVEDYLEEYMRGHGNEGKCECDELLRRLFTFHADSNTIEANFSLWSNGFITAKGKGPDGSDTPAGATVLSALNDVALSGLAAGQVLKFDGSKWVNADAILDAPDIDLSGYLAKSEAASLYAAVNHTHSQYALSSDLAGFLTKTYDLTMQAGKFSAVTYDPSAKAAAVSIPTSTDHLAEGASKFFTEDRAKSALAGHTSDSAIHVTADDKAKWNGADELLRRLFTFHADSNTIEANFSLWSDGFITAKGKGPDGSAASGLDPDAVRALLVQWDYVTRADLPSLSEYATEKWVNAQGFLTRHQSLAGYLTKTAADNAYQPKGDYLTSVSWADVGGKPTWIGASKPSYSWGEIGSKPAFAYTAAECTSYTADGSDKGVTAAAVKKAFTLFKAVPPAFSEVAAKPTTMLGYGITDAYDKAAIDSKVTAINTAINGKVSKSGDTMSGALTVNAKVTAQSLTIGSNTLTWDADAKAWKIDGNLYATGFITAKGQGAGGSASAGGLDLAALEAYLTQNKYATQSWVNGLGHITKAAADSAYQPKGSYAAANHTHSQYLTQHQSLDFLNVKDVRGSERLPSYFGNFKASLWFNMNGTPSSTWYSGLQVKGWTNDYASWQICANSTNSASENDRLYFRTGIGSTWHAWKTIAFTSDLSAYLPLSGGTISSAANGPLNINSTSGTEVGMRFKMSNANKGWVGYNPTYGVNLYNYASNRYVGLKDDGQFYHQGSNVFWHAGNDGAGSGLDADTLDGHHETAFVRSWWTASPGYDCAAHNSRPLISFTYSNNAPFTGAFMDVCVNGYGFYLGTQYNSDSPLYYRRHGTSGDGKMGEWQRLARLSEVYTKTEGDGRYARLASPNNMVHSTNEWTVIPDGYSQSTLWLNYGAGAGGTASNFNTLIIGNGTKGALASVKAKSFIVADGYSIGPGSTALQMTTPHGFVDIGPKNANYAHIYTDRPSFYFNKPLLVNGGTVWHSGNDGSGSGLDADLLDGVHYRNILERHYTVTRSQDAAAKWYRVAKFLASNTSGASGLLKIERSYYSPQNEGYIFAISLGYNGDINISQIAGVVGVQIITKMRVTCANSGEAYVDVYCGYTGYQNSLHVTAIGGLTALDITPDPATLAITKEYVPHRGMGSDMGFIGNASTATALRDRTNGTASYLNYGAAGLATASWLAAWNGYELRAISPSNVRSVIGAVAKAGDTMTGSLLMANGTAKIGVSDGVANDNAYGLVNVTRNANDDNLSYYGFVVSGKHARGIGLNKSGNFVIGSASTSKVISPWLTISSAELVKTAANAAFKASNGTSTIGLYNSTNRGVYDFTKDNWLIATNGTNTWLSVGYVGIGTTTPAYRLDVNGSIIAGSWVRTRGAAGWYSETYGGGWHMLDSTWLRSYNNKPLYVSQGTGIGASGFCVGAHLHGDSHSSIEVSGGAYTMGLGCHSNGGWYWWRGTANPTSSYANKSYVMEYNGTTWKFTGILHATTGIYSDGYITAKTGSSSDARLKDIIGSPSLTLEQVAASPLVRFRWKKDGGIAIGTIAQHWLNVLEEVVYKDPDGYYAVQYGVLADAKATVVARAVMGHERRIEALERENRELKERIKQLEAA